MAQDLDTNTAQARESGIMRNGSLATSPNVREHGTYMCVCLGVCMWRAIATKPMLRAASISWITTATAVSGIRAHILCSVEYVEAASSRRCGFDYTEF